MSSNENIQRKVTFCTKRQVTFLYDRWRSAAYKSDQKWLPVARSHVFKEQETVNMTKRRKKLFDVWYEKLLDI